MLVMSFRIRNFWIIAMICLIGIGLFGTLVTVIRVHNAFFVPLGGVHRFSLEESEPYLTERTAIRMAKETMFIEGYEPTQWILQPDHRTASPDGRKDNYLARNKLNHNRGQLLYVGPKDNAICVSIELRGNIISCELIRTK